jgi:hypothetical protein
MALLGCVVLAGTGPGTAGDDLSVLRELRPAQRENLVFVQRDGAARVIAYDPAVEGPQIAALGRPHMAPRPAFELPHFEPRVPGLLALRNGRLFVPTTAIAKPRAPAAPKVPPVDLAWLYAHRFDAPAERVPGVPVRSQVSSPFDVDSGAFHGVRAVNGWSAVRVAVSIPCGVSHFVTGPGYDPATGETGTVDQETGYIYIGGWGAGPRGVSVDAGLQRRLRVLLEVRRQQAGHVGEPLPVRRARRRARTLSGLRVTAGVLGDRRHGRWGAPHVYRGAADAPRRRLVARRRLAQRRHHPQADRRDRPAGDVASPHGSRASRAFRQR